MKKNWKISYYLNTFAKIICIAGVVGSFAFFGWRVINKRAYMREQMAQCRAYAASAMLVAADVLSQNGPTAQLVQQKHEIKFTADHTRVPGDNGITLLIRAENGGYAVKCLSTTGWNSRAPQSCTMQCSVSASGELSFADKETGKYTMEIKNAACEPDKFTQQQLFSYEFDIQCPAPYHARIAKLKNNQKIRIFVSDNE